MAVVNRLLTLFILSLLAFALARLAPGDPAALILRSSGEEPSPAAIEALQVQLGLNRSWPEQYLIWGWRLVCCLDLGISFNGGGRVAAEFLARLPATLTLTAAAAIITIVLSLGGGLLSAWQRRSWLDWAAWLTAMLGASLPGYWLGLLLAYFFGVYLGWLPVSGYGQWQQLVLPALSLALIVSATQIQLFRARLLTALAEPHILTAQAKGLSRRQVLLCHALPRAIGPNIQALGLSIGQMLAGSAIIETIFAWPGVGRLAVESVLRRDYPMIQAYVLLIGFIFILITFLTDLAHAWCDPLARLSLRGEIDYET
ncbi:MAG: ABC transporter permease [Anaerolineae bacterium]